MVVSNRHFMRSVDFPYKANPVLVIDPDAVLSGAIMLESFQPITRRRLEIAEIDRRFYLIQFPQRDLLNIRPSCIGSLYEEFSSILAFKTLDHLS
jgi:hypothetical protein